MRHKLFFLFSILTVSITSHASAGCNSTACENARRSLYICESRDIHEEREEILQECEEERRAFTIYCKGCPLPR